MKLRGLELPTVVARALDALERQLETDARSLALGRVTIALLSMYDLALRAKDLTAHYTDEGVLPRSAFRLSDWSFVWSLHMASGGALLEIGLFAAAGLAAVALAIGFETRAATFGSFLCALSLQGRNPFLHDGQDDLLRVVLFWCLFLPLGRRWSLDALIGSPREAETAPVPRGSGVWEVPSFDRVSGLLAFGLAGQLLLIYWSSAVGKLQSGWWTHGQGILRALALGRYETAAGQWLLRFPMLLRVASFPVIALELGLPLLLWVPWRRARVRLGTVALATALHLAFGVFLQLSIFPLLSAAVWWLWLPAQVWERRPRAAAPEPQTSRERSTALFALPLLVLVALYVAGTHLPKPVLPAAARRALEALGLQQYWVVFSPPDPQTVSDGYFVAPGLLPDGRQVDLFSGDGPVTWARPALISATFADTRWRHFYANLVVEWARGSDQWRTTLAAREATVGYLCKDYAARHPNGAKLFRVSLYFVEHWVERPGGAPRRRLLAQTPCGE